MPLFILERVTGFGPVLYAWQAHVLPLTPYPHMELEEGVEPTTYRLQGDCSAIELFQHLFTFYIYYKIFFYKNQLFCSKKFEKPFFVLADGGT